MINWTAGQILGCYVIQSIWLGKKQTYLSHGLFIWFLKKIGRGLVRLTSAAEDLKNRNSLCENMKM